MDINNKLDNSVNPCIIEGEKKDIFYENKNIRMLLEELKKQQDNYKSLIRDFIVFYLKNGRHRYSKVAEYISEEAIKDEQVVIYILYNIENLLQYCDINGKIIDDEISTILECKEYKDKEFNRSKLIEKIIKLQDHIELERQRIIFSQRKESKIFSNLIDQVNESIKDANKDLDCKVDDIQNNLTSGIVSVLGIFSAIVMVFFGGLNIFSSIMSNLAYISKFRVIFMGSLVSMTMFDVIFLLLYSISKILGKNIGTSLWPPKILYKNDYQYRKECSKYENASRYGIKKIFIRYPIVFVFNVFMIIIQIVTFISWYIYQKYSIKKLIVLIVSIAIFIAIYSSIRLMIYNIKKRCDNCKSNINNVNNF
ncbi:hypothetical protein FDF74_12200 [Clostridium niameyense]|uniref:Uncharacterized protein n=1 Tax=Clostridium niameyense TaxID=1622073 RepID=A0A6M0RCQ1_9CLOT|nr:hypothetical protein [Clostridium niameyense]NEZ47943.1 hypothetical protein [Clostridium niameyense]